jgi:hypothetical protein
LSVDSSKLDSAPTLSRSSWAEINDSSWSQRVNSYFGISGSSSMGGAESPSGSSSSGSSGSSGDSRGSSSNGVPPPNHQSLGTP